MMTELKLILRRSSGTLPGDLAGAAALVVMLFAALHLPSLT